MDREEIRPAALAGSFYPGTKLVLERDLSLLLENSPMIDNKKPIRGMIVPHAGYMYSGGVAARAYRQIIPQKIDVVIIIAPSHHEFFDFISVFPGRAFETPLGYLYVDQNMADALTALHPDIRLSYKGYSPDEHSLEVQLPLLKWVQDSVKILPVMMANQGHEMIEILSSALGKLLVDKNFLIIASSDLSHFHPDGQARSMDQVVINHVNNFEADELFNDILAKRCEMCGYGPAISTMKAVKSYGVQEARVLLYRNSGDITGDRESVVGYLSAVFY